jgi:WD40 repeat protein
VIVVDPDTGEYIRGVEGFYDQGGSPPRRYWSVDYQEYAELDNHRLLLSNGVDIEIRNNFLYASWSPNGAYIATVTHFPNDYSFEIQTWNTTTGDSINVFASGMFAFRGLVWSPDSMRIAALLEHPTGSNVYLRGFRVFTVAAGDDYLFDRSDHQIFANANIDITAQQAKAAWNSDVTMLAVVLPDVLEIHALQGDGTPLVSLTAYGIVDLEWSGDDRFIAAGSEDGTIRIWGVPTSD